MNICKCCGRTLDLSFMYCPWCGDAKHGLDKAHLDDVFYRLEEKQAIDRQRRVSEMQSRLDELDKELSVLALSYEMSR